MIAIRISSDSDTNPSFTYFLNLAATYWLIF